MPPKRRAVCTSSNNTPPTKSPIRASSLSSPRIPSKRQSSHQIITGTKRKALPKPNLKRAAPFAVFEATEDKVSADEGESQNPQLDDDDQSSHSRQPAVNSDILPLPWKGRLGFACILCISMLIVDV
jgi:hypothetical protein